MTTRLLTFGFVLGFLSSCDDGDEGGQDRHAEPPRHTTYGLDERPANASCHAVARPGSSGGITLTPAFPALTLDEPVGLVRQRLHPGDGASAFWFVVEKGGRIRAFRDASAGAATTLVDLSAVVLNEGESGLLGLAFDPDYSADPAGVSHSAYVYYTGGTDSGLHACPLNRYGDRLCSFLSRFEITSGDGGSSFEVGKETVLMRVQQPYDTHKAGQIAFGPDGFLYVALGDGGLAFDPHCAGQNPNTPLAKILRIDVRSGAVPYGIPADNPFAGTGGLCNDHSYRFATDAFVDNPDISRDAPCPETFAWGFRNPWRFSFDRATGDLWVGDVGQDLREEVDLVTKGRNYGWNVREGTTPLPAWASCSNGEGAELTAPVIEYSHASGLASITGGYVYRGSALPEYGGHYFFTDSSNGDLWAIASPYEITETLADPAPILEATGAFVSMAEDEAGELYVVDMMGGPGRSVLAVRPTAESGGSLPALLSRTGCVDAADPSKPAPGLIPYTVSSPLWSDRADKERYMALPDGARVHVADDGHFDFPVGTVLVKLFRRGGVLLETRLLMLHDDGDWGGYTYIWNDAQTEAFLATGRETRTVGGDVWTFPSRGDCMDCHTSAASRSLGPEVAQLNGDMTYPTNRIANQLATLDHIGVLEAPLTAIETLPALADPYGDGPLEPRARAYLHANCAHCHQPGGTIGAAMDLRFATPLAATATCDVRPLQGGDYGVTDARLIAPGEAERSLVYLRVATDDPDLMMPAFGRHEVDTEAAELLRAWIDAMGSCP